MIRIGDSIDAALACDDEQIQAHRVNLSAWSQIFRNILFKGIFNVAYVQKIFGVKSVAYETHEKIFPF